jgi:hypothetical protein
MTDTEHRGTAARRTATTADKVDVTTLRVSKVAA